MVGDENIAEVELLLLDDKAALVLDEGKGVRLVRLVELLDKEAIMLLVVVVDNKPERVGDCPLEIDDRFELLDEEVLELMRLIVGVREGLLYRLVLLEERRENGEVADPPVEGG